MVSIRMMLTPAFVTCPSTIPSVTAQRDRFAIDENVKLTA
jgi:hypothetical protein